MSKKNKPVSPPPGLPLTGVESHAHLNGKQFKDDLPEVLRRAREAGVEWLGQVFLHPEAWREGRKLFDEYPWVFFLLGIHPTEAGELNNKVLFDISKAIQEDSRIKAIGEIGLDYYWKDCPPEVQKPVFLSQLGLARQTGLPVVIHSRDAADDTFAILEAEGFKGYDVLWHCFGGDIPMARRIVDNGWMLSIPGPVTFPSNHDLREAVAWAPLDRLMVETDCPYLAPAPLRGKRNEPAYAAYTIEAMARARNMAPADLWSVCGNNAKRFFRLEAQNSRVDE